MRPLVWFRSDLRTADNPALNRACADASRGAIAVFLVCPGQWRAHHRSDMQVKFTLRSLDELSQRLSRLNVPLLVRWADGFQAAPETTLGLARQHECDALFYNREYEPDEAARDGAVAEAFRRAGLIVRGFHDQTVLAPGALQTSAGGFYTVFTPFRRAWIKRLREQGIPTPQAAPKRQPSAPVNPDSLPSSIRGFDAGAGRPDLWPAGEAVARRRLVDFIENRLRDYRRRRDEPAADATSRLSPYLAVGAISARQCLGAAVEANGNSLNGRRTGPAAWIGELVWREFSRHLLVGYPRVGMNRPYRLEIASLRWRRENEDLHAWQEGRTGVPIVDAAMRQLRETGWMHNRLRMITATFLTKDLFIDWRLGERHFMRHLIDGDLASNNGGWQWCAFTGADAAPYSRVFNPYRQSERHDPDGTFIRRWVPELADLERDTIHDPSRLPDSQRDRLDYPAPIVDHREAAARAVVAFRKLRNTR